MVLITVIGTNLMPWYFAAQLITILFGQEIHIVEPRFADYVLLAIIYIVAVIVILLFHQSWDGLKSVEQYQREEQGEPANLVAEATSELKRLISRKPSISGLRKPNTSFRI